MKKLIWVDWDEPVPPRRYHLAVDAGYQPARRTLCGKRPWNPYPVDAEGIRHDDKCKVCLMIQRREKIRST